MKIKPLNKQKSERPVGQWIDGRFYATKIKKSGRLAQLQKAFHKKTDSEAVAMWRRIDNLQVLPAVINMRKHVSI